MAFLRIDKAERVVTGVVYEPGVLDLDNEFTDEREIQRALYSWAERGARLTINHGPLQVRLRPLEFFQARSDFEEGGQKVRKGSWVLAVRVADDGVWKAIEDGELRGFSMGGRSGVEDATIGGHSVMAVLDTLMAKMAEEFVRAGVRDERALVKELVKVDWRAEVGRVARAVDPSAPVDVLVQVLDD
jgi:Putative phage serine protease XkdF